MHHCCSTTLTAASQHSTTPQSFSKATVFGGAAFWQFSAELLFGEGSLPGEAFSAGALAMTSEMSKASG